VDYVSGNTVTLEALGSGSYITGENLAPSFSDDTLTINAAEDIDATTLYLNAGNSINGNDPLTGMTKFTPVDSLTTNASNITAFANLTTGDADIYDSNTVSTTLVNVQANNVNVVNASNTIVDKVVGTTNATIESQNGYIKGNNHTLQPDIKTVNLYLSAAQSVYGSYTPSTVFHNVTAPNKYLTTNASNITAFANLTTGDADIYDSNTVSTTLVNVQANNVNVVTKNNNIVDEVVGTTNATLESQTGSIEGNNVALQPDITTVNLYLSAAQSIYGLYVPSSIDLLNNNLGFLTTNASTIHSHAGANSNTNIFDLNGTDLVDVEGDNINIIANTGDITASTVIGMNTAGAMASISLQANAGDIIIPNGGFISATVIGSGTSDTANIYMNASGNITISSSLITAFAVSGSATIDLTATNGAIGITDSFIASTVIGNGASTIDINAEAGDVTISKDIINAIVGGTNLSDEQPNITINAGGDITIDPATILVAVHNGNATINLQASGAISITDKSSITADAPAPSVGNGTSAVTITANGTGGITIDDSKVIASVPGNGSSIVAITANAGGITITDDSNINAIVGGTNSLDSASVTLTAYDGGSITIGASTITAQVKDGAAAISLDTDATTDSATAGTSISITDSDLTAFVTGTNAIGGSAGITIDAGTTVTINTAATSLDTILANVAGEGSSTIAITANGGDVIITNGGIMAITEGGSSSTITIKASGDIMIDPSIISTVAGGSGDSETPDPAEITITANGSITIATSTITAQAQDGIASITLGAGDAINVTDSGIIASVTDASAITGINESASVGMTTTSGLISITDSGVTALVAGDGTSAITITAGGDVTIAGSGISVLTNGSNPLDAASVSMSASGTITMGSSAILAQIPDGSAMVNLTATNGAISITDSGIMASVIDDGATTGLATVTITSGSTSTSVVDGVTVTTLTGGDITMSNSGIEASVAGDGSSIVEMTAYNGAITETNSSNIGAQVNGGADSDITSISMIANGDITINSSTIISSGYDSSVSLFANGSIVGVNDGQDDIQTVYLNLFASDSIYGDYMPSGLNYPPAANGFLTTNAQFITAGAYNNIQIYDINSVTLQSVVVTNVNYYGNVTLEALNGDITGGNASNLTPPDILTGNLYLYASGSISGNYPTTGGSLTTNAGYILDSASSISIYDILTGGARGVVLSNASPASIDIVANGSITVDYVSAFSKNLNINTPEPILLGGGDNDQIQTAAGGVSYDHSLGSGYEAEPTFFFYHPLSDIDSSSFDNIVLDAGAYEFIEDELKNFKGVVPGFFGAT
jgi:hypothetical protein